MDKIFAKALKTLLWDFLSPPSQDDLKFFFTNGDPSLFLLADVKFYGEKIEKTDDPEILHCRQMKKQITPN